MTLIKNSKEGHKVKVDDNVGTSKYKNVFVKVYTPNWREEMFVIKKIKNVRWTIVISDLNDEEIVGTYYGKEFQKKQIKKNLLKSAKEKRQ